MQVEIIMTYSLRGGGGPLNCPFEILIILYLSVSFESFSIISDKKINENNILQQKTFLLLSYRTFDIT